MSAAQNQHYVPKFILRNFLADERKEQVCVFDKLKSESFTTSIKNILAERRFNEFIFDEFIISFEKAAWEIEEMLLPAYRKVLAERKLDKTPQQQADLAFLVAFQLTRAKGHREMSKDIRSALESAILSSGAKLEDIPGWTPADENTEKMHELILMKSNINRFAEIIAGKDFFLAEAGQGRSFYLGDDPVCLHNLRDTQPYGNLGLAVEGIQIYMPLSHDLMLCALCPTIVEGEMGIELESKQKRIRDNLFSRVLAGEIPAAHMRDVIQRFDAGNERAREIKAAIKDGNSIQSDNQNMDFYNSLQVSCATRYVIAKDGDFALAAKHAAEFPGRGRRISVA